MSNMQNIESILKDFGLEIPEDKKEQFRVKFHESYKTVKDYDKAVNDRDSWKQRAESAEETLKGFDGKDFDTIIKERDDWKKKAEDSEKNYAAKIAEREKEDLLKEAFAGIKFTSEAAKKSIMAQIAESVSVKNGKLIGFNDLLEEVKKSDASAFVDEGQQQLETNRARFTTRHTGNNPGEKQYTDSSEIMKIKDPSERQRAWAEYLENKSE